MLIILGYATNTPIVKAGANFGLTADTGVVGYNGVPKVNWLS